MSRGRSAKSPRSGIEIMDSNVSLRVATLQDLQSLPNIYKEFHNFHAESIPDRLVSITDQQDGRDETNLFQKLNKIIQSEDSEIFIAEANREPIGLAEIYLRQDEINPLTVPYRYVYPQSLIITNSYRRQGIGTQLMKMVEGWAKERGVSEIRLDIWEFNEGPLPFYRQMGYQTLKRTMVHQICKEQESNG